MLAPRAVDLIKRFEGLRLTQYYCEAGVSTIGYGATRMLDGSPVPVGAVIDKEEAEILLVRELAGVETRVRDLFRKTGLSELQTGALASFAYNLGMGALRGSTLARRVREGLHEEAATEFLRWHHAGGRDSKGLMIRRRAEANLYMEGTADGLG